MAVKSERVDELKDSIAQAVATLDMSDASRIGLQEAFDSVREILKEAYGVGFERDVSGYVSDDEIADEDDDDAEDGDADGEDEDEDEDGDDSDGDGHRG